MKCLAELFLTALEKVAKVNTVHSDQIRNYCACMLCIFYWTHVNFWDPLIGIVIIEFHVTGC